MSITHVLSATTPDDPLYEIRPSHWNSAHAQALTITGNTAGQSTWSGTNLVYSGGANATLSLNGDTLVFSGGAGGAGNTGYISGGTTNASLGTVSLADSNGISFGVNGQTVTASYTVPSTAGLLSNIRVSAGTTSNLLSALTFADSNGLSFGINASTVTASHNGLTSQSNQNVTAGNGGFAFQTLSFSNANGFSFGTSAGSAITGSYTVPTQTNQSGGIYALGNTTGQSSSSTYDARTLSIEGAGIVSVGWSNSSLRVSATQSNQAFSADASSTFQTLTFQNSNGISFSNNAGAIRLTHDLAGTSTGFAGANISGSMTHNSAGLNLSLSVAAPGAAAENNNINLLGANTAGNTTASGSTIGLSGVNVTLSGTNNSVVVISVPAPVTLSGWIPDHLDQTVLAHAQGSVYLNPRVINRPFQFDRMVMPFQFSQATNSTLTVSNGVWWGFYTRNASTLSLHVSGSGSFSINGSGTASSNNNSGNRVVSFGQTTTITENNYVFALVWTTGTAGANASLSHIHQFFPNSSYSGYIGLASGTRMNILAGRGVWTSTSSGLPNSIAFSDIRGISGIHGRQPLFYFTSGEITF